MTAARITKKKTVDLQGNGSSIPLDKKGGAASATKRPVKRTKKNITKKKPKRKKLSWYKDKANALFSEIVRREEAEVFGIGECYTCGLRAHWRTLQCGHGIPGRHGAVLYDRTICRSQCVACNVFRGGMLHVFTAKLIAANGQKWWEKKERDSHKSVIRRIADYELLIDEFAKKLQIMEENANGN